MRITVKIVVVHRALKVVPVETGHRGGRRDRVLMMLHRETARRSDDKILEAQIVAAATSATAAAAAASGEFEAPPGPAAPLHTIEG